MAEDERSRIDERYERKFDTLRRTHPLPSDFENEEDYQDALNQKNGVSDAENEEAENLAAQAPSAAQPQAQANQDSDAKPKGGLGKLLQKRKTLIGLGLGGGTAGLFALLIMFLPLKIDSFIANATRAAAAVPTYAVEQRGEYLLTRALATRILMVANKNISDVDGKLAFCGNGSISCSLFTTYTSSYFEDKMDMTFEKRSSGKVRVTITPKGRTSLGSKATSWDVTTHVNLSEDHILETVKSITTNAEMKNYIKVKVNTNLKESSTLTRFIARRILMKKYGVTNWRAAEGTMNTISEARTKLKTWMYKNTVGKILPRLAGYFGCLQGGAVCDQLSQLGAEGPDPEKVKQQYGPDSDEYKKAVKLRASYDKIAQGAAQAAGDIPAEGVFGGIISKKVLLIVGGAAAVIPLIDALLTAVDTAQNGAIDKISADMVTQTYTGWAFGDQAGVVTNDEKRKAGDFSGDDLTMAQLDSMIDCSGSALCAYQNGIIPDGGTVAAASTRIQRTCSTPDGDKPVLLEVGQLVCSNMRIVQHITDALVNNPAWQGVAAVAKVWVKLPVHSILEAIGSVTGALMSPAIQVMGALVTKAAPNLKASVEKDIAWAFATVFNIPNIGPDAPPANNYDALAGGIAAEQNELGFSGVDENGKAMGSGGYALTSQQVDDLQNIDKADQLADFNSRSTFAKIFDPTLFGSVAQKLVVQTPSSLTGLASLPLTALQNFSSLGTAGAISQAKMTNSPFGLTLHGYAVGDPILAANPAAYTEAACTASAAAREASLTTDRSISPLAIYKKSDPCALEKQTVCVGLASAGVTDDPNSCPAVDAPGSGQSVNVMTYNVLGTEAAKKDGVDISWKTRINDVISTIKTASPDVMGFQEVTLAGTPDQSSELRNGLADTYTSFPTGSDSGIQRPIFWRSANFSMIKHGTYSYPRYGEAAAQMPWVELKRSTGETFYVFNTHLAAGGKGDSQYNSVDGLNPPKERKQEAEKLVDAIKKNATDGSPVILTGDFNSTCQVTGNDDGVSLDELPCSILREAGFTDSAAQAATKTNFEYNTTHGTAGGDFTKTSDGSEGRHIDHVFYNGNLQAASWQTIINPTTQKASDHTPVTSTIVFPAQATSGSALASGFAWPLGKDKWESNKSLYLKPHIAATGTAWGADNMGTGNKDPNIAKGAGIAADLGVAEGTPVYAMLSGTVTSTNLCGANDGIAIKSIVGGKTLGIAYMHGKNKRFKVGDLVNAGDQIMDVGQLGCHVYGAHVHIGMAYDGKYLCPQDVFVAMAAGKTADLGAFTGKANVGCGGRTYEAVSPL